jgi:hypothetical protein
VIFTIALMMPQNEGFERRLATIGILDIVLTVFGAHAWLPCRAVTLFCATLRAVWACLRDPFEVRMVIGILLTLVDQALRFGLLPDTHPFSPPRLYPFQSVRSASAALIEHLLLTAARLNKALTITATPASPAAQKSDSPLSQPAPTLADPSPHALPASLASALGCSDEELLAVVLRRAANGRAADASFAAVVCRLTLLTQQSPETVDSSNHASVTASSPFASALGLTRRFVALLRASMAASSLEEQRGRFGLLQCIRTCFAFVDASPKTPSALTLATELVALACGIADSMMRVVGTAAPEGYAPSNEPVAETGPAEEEGDDNEENDHSDAERSDQDEESEHDHGTSGQVPTVLLGAWRAVKEACLLLSALMQHVQWPAHAAKAIRLGGDATFAAGEPSDDARDARFDEMPSVNGAGASDRAVESTLGAAHPNRTSLHSSPMVVSIAEFLVELQLLARHRGAVDKINDAVRTACAQLWTSADARLASLPELWLTRALQFIETSSAGTITRRSAGLPLLIQTVLVTQPLPRVAAPRLAASLIALVDLADERSEATAVSSVHALNVLRVLVRDGDLASELGPAIGAALQKAIQGFAVSNFAVRNSCMMLFSSLMQRVFGVKKVRDEQSFKNRLHAREFFQRYPQLLSFFLDVLESHTSSVLLLARDRSPLYATLVVLARLLPAALASGGVDPAETLQRRVVRCLSRYGVWLDVDLRVGADGCVWESLVVLFFFFFPPMPCLSQVLFSLLLPFLH